MDSNCGSNAGAGSSDDDDFVFHFERIGIDFDVKITRDVHVAKAQKTLTA